MSATMTIREDGMIYAQGCVGVEAIAIRKHNGRVKLVNCLMEIGEISRDDAEKVATLYLSRKIRAVEIGNGDFRIRGANGALFERSPIRTAVEMLRAGTI